MTRVLIDAGHGIDTSGKRSPDGSFREYLWNRQVADLLHERLQVLGIDATQVVTETNDISLQTRVMRVNKECDRYGVGNIILVSIHSDAAGDGQSWHNASGWSCYTTQGKTKSDVLAECLYEAVSKEFPDKRMRKDLTDGDSDIESNFYILRKSRCPAVLVENFFYDNKDECRWLLQHDTKVRIATALALGISRYIDL